MRLSIGTKIAIGFFLAMAALVAVGLTAHFNLIELSSDSALVTHTVEVQRNLESLQAGIVEVESSSRGYNLVPLPEFKQSAKDAEASIHTNFRTLRDLTLDNPIEQTRLDRLDPLITERLEDLRKLADLRDAGAADQSAQRDPLVTGGRETMTEIHQLLTDMMGEEQRLLKVRQDRAATMAEWTSQVTIYGMLLALFLVGFGGWLVTRSITHPLATLGEGAAKIGGGDYAYRVTVKSKDEVGHLAVLFNRMAEQVEERQHAQGEQDWLKTGLTRFGVLFQGQRNLGFLCHAVLADLASVLDARHSVLYLPVAQANGKMALKLQAGYAAEGAPEEITPGEGLIGECFVEKKRVVLDEVPADYLQIKSALGQAPPRTLVVQPALFDGNVKAVLELALFQKPTAVQLDFLGQLSESIGIVLQTIEGATRTEELLKQAQMLSQDLQARQAELSVKNEELESQAVRLRSSELQLQEQQEELKQTNEELEQTNEEMEQTNEEMEEKVNLLALQKKEMERANGEIETARGELEKKAVQLTTASKYKSDFLANMSHELRTPLNSLLILSKLLSDNPDTNLTDKQVQYARTIYSSGNDLLELINEILDLARIESGAVKIDVGDAALAEVCDFVEQNFRAVAETKHLGFEVQLDGETPQTINTDLRRLEQVLKNLLANAFKFTQRGSVKLKIEAVKSGWDRHNQMLNHAPQVISFAVTDTGIGIPEEKQNLIFEAFQQADAGTARKFGGTGLGLSISREIAQLLGGSLAVASVVGQGSTFTLFLPAAYAAEWSAATAAAASAPERPRKTTAPVPTRENSVPAEPVSTENEMDDDRAALLPGDVVLLIIEDDRNFAQIMMDFAREKRFKVIIANTAAQGLAWARKVNPSAITLDLHLPDNDGWVVLDQLKHDGKTRHIPIHIISVDEERERSLRLGAVSYFQKPVTREVLEGALTRTMEFINRPLKNLLIIEDDSVQRESLVELIGNGDVHSTAVGSGAEALRVMESTRFDCVVLDLGLPDLDGFDLIREMHRRFGPEAPPIIVYTGQELSRQEETELRLISESIVVKNVRSPERLLDETALFLHRVQTKLPEPKRRMIEQVHKNESVLSGRKVLVVDDDVRNIFAITSALEAAQMQVVYAESGQAALDLLDKQTDVDVILMDVMMPEMDGYEAIRRIRRLEKFRKLPIISVTAKAMKGDREKCIEAGASDYITKPVDLEQLRSLLRVWLYK